MKKRIEKVVEFKNVDGNLTEAEKYNVFAENKVNYSVMDKYGDFTIVNKKYFKVVSEKEVLEFEGDDVNLWNTIKLYLEVASDIDLENYDLKVIATPKDKTYEEMSKEELIELLKSKE